MSFFVSRSVTFYSDDPWREDVILIDERGYVNSRVERFPVRLQSLFRRWFEFRFACYLLSLSAKNDSIAVGRYGLWVPILAKFLHLKRYIILTDIEWPKVKSGLLNRTAALASKALCCFTSEESKRYSRQYRIPENKFHLVHTPFDLTNLREPVDSEYIFTGGYQARDWDTLLRAVKDLPYPVHVL
ncbi:hypothetical protein HY745_09110 [Candidatus Desantisbacteria bacterium]|nr:hypothetical protein [Candidatus Desantisbacteria bacterium]